MLSNNFPLLEDDLENHTFKEVLRLYDYIFDKIKEAKQLSEKSKKPVLILFGEQHNSLFSSIAEMVAISAAIQLGFKQFCNEFDDYRYVEELERIVKYRLDKEKYRSFVDNEMSLATGYYSNVTGMWNKGKLDYSIFFLSCLRLYFEPIDQGNNGVCLVSYNRRTAPTGIDVFNPKAIKYRNEIMAEKLNECTNKDTFAIVGAGHLYGLSIEESSLTENFEIVEFNSYPLPTISSSDVYVAHVQAKAHLLNDLFFTKENKKVSIDLFAKQERHFDIIVKDYFVDLGLKYLASNELSALPIQPSRDCGKRKRDEHEEEDHSIKLIKKESILDQNMMRFDSDDSMFNWFNPFSYYQVNKVITFLWGYSDSKKDEAPLLQKACESSQDLTVRI